MSLSTRGGILVKNFSASPHAAPSQPPNAQAIALLRNHFTSAPPIQSQELVYCDLHGSEATRDVLSKFLSKRILHRAVSGDNIIVCNSLTSIVNSLAISLCERGDGALIPQSCFDQFSFMLKYRAGVHPFAVPPMSASPLPEVTPQSLQRAWLQAGGESSRVRILLLDLAELQRSAVYTQAAIHAIIRWTRSKNIHIIADQSVNVFAPDHNTKSFVSSWQVADPQNDIHVLWDVSKSLQVPSLALTCLVTGNQALLRLLKSIVIVGSASRQSERIIQHILPDIA